MFNEDLWQKLKNESLPIVLYGTGNAAEKIASLLEERGIEISGIFASDDFVRNKVFLGHQVKSLAALEAELGDFVVLLCFGTHLPDVTEKIKAVSEKHRLYAPDIPVVGDGLFDLGYYRGHAARFDALSRRLADDQSRKVLDCVIKYKLSGDLRYLFEAESAESEQWELAAGLAGWQLSYAAARKRLTGLSDSCAGGSERNSSACAGDGRVRMGAAAPGAAALRNAPGGDLQTGGPGEECRSASRAQLSSAETQAARPAAPVLLDLGAYTGDTARLYAELCPGFKAIYAAEPEARNFRKLSEFAEVYNSEHSENAIYPLNIGIGDKDEKVMFSVGGGRGSRSKKLAPVEFRSVDSLFAETLAAFSSNEGILIKMDLEGWEIKALEGAKRTVLRRKPNLLISAYHRTDDLLSIPEFILSLDPSYKVYLRHSHCVPAWEVNYVFVK